MNRSPLQLNHYHFVTLALRACDGFDSGKLTSSKLTYPDFDEIELQPEVTLFSNDDDGEYGPYMLRLVLIYEPEENTFPYSFEVIIEGIFSITQDSDFKDCKKIVLVNGASVLYAAVREQLMSISSRHLYGPMLLPTLNFQQLDLSKEQEARPSR